VRPICLRDGETVTPTVDADIRLRRNRPARPRSDADLRARSVFGEIASPINSYFALIADDPSVPDPSMPRRPGMSEDWRRACRRSPACRSFRLPRRSNAAAEAARITTPTRRGTDCD